MNAKASETDEVSAPSGARAQARFVRVTPMKARRVIDLIRGRSAADALSILKYSPQTAAKPVAKVVASAVANAENNYEIDPDTLLVSAAWVDEGPTLKRFRPRAQGRAFRIRKRTCHITVELTSIAKDSTTTSRRGRGAAKGRTR